MMILSQVNKHFLKRCRINQFLRHVHNDKSSQVLYPLESRRLLRIEGKDAAEFLQGLITNDMRHFEDGAQSMYAMFLNNKGRVLYDTLIHKRNDENSFILECDKNIIGLLQKHLKIYKLKRKVEVEDISQQYNLWTLIPLPHELIQYEVNPKNDVNVYKDPRLCDLGYRVLSLKYLEGPQVAERIGKNIIVEKNEDGYIYHRYKLGVSEGATDLVPAACFPLEVNCDYLHGVSFHKGCYIGQELTARVHHTGVVRKRIMPLRFTEHVNKNLDKDTVISASDNPKTNLGKLKNYMNDYGLGLVRIKEAIEATRLSIGTYTAEVIKPPWWPIEAPKEKVSVTKD